MELVKSRFQQSPLLLVGVFFLYRVHQGGEESQHSGVPLTQVDKQNQTENSFKVGPDASVTVVNGSEIEREWVIKEKPERIN